MSHQLEAAALLRELLELRLDSCPPSSADDAHRYFLNARRPTAALHWRLCSLAEATIACLDSRRNLAAVVLARAAFKTAAVIHYVEESVAAVRSGASIEDEDKKLTRVSLGRKDKRWKPDLADEHLAVNVVTCIQRVDMHFNDDTLPLLYEDASEYSQPNWFGTIGLFKRSNGEETDVFDLVSDSDDEHTADVGALTLAVSLRTGLTFF